MWIKSQHTIAIVNTDEVKYFYYSTDVDNKIHYVRACLGFEKDIIISKHNTQEEAIITLNEIYKRIEKD